VSKLARAIDTVLVDCLGVRPDENVLVLTDPAKRHIAEPLVQRARDLGADALLMEMAERATHGTEPPAPVAASMLAADVLIAERHRRHACEDDERELCRGSQAFRHPGGVANRGCPRSHHVEKGHGREFVD
jgi:hypothetical protein